MARLGVRAISHAQVLTGHYDSQGNASMPLETGQASSEARAAWYEQLTFFDAARDGQRGSATAVPRISGTVSALVPGFINAYGPDNAFVLVDGNGCGAVPVGGTGLYWKTQP